MVGFTGAVLALAPAVAAAETASVATTLADQIVAGQDLYSIHCVECHGDDGKVTEITAWRGWKARIIRPSTARTCSTRSTMPPWPRSSPTAAPMRA